MMEDIKSYIIRKREQLGISQKDFAMLLGMNKNGERTVRGWEIGEHKPSPTRLQKIKDLEITHPFKFNEKKESFTFIDLFAGIGGIRLPFQEEGGKCVFSSEKDKFAKQTYFANYGEYPDGDITKISARDIPNHDILLAGFPCQAFSQAGLKLGFKDTRGTMFFEIQRILAEKQPKMFLLENVKRLKTDSKGKTYQTIYEILTGQHQEDIPADIPMSEDARRALSIPLNYWVTSVVLRATDFGIPQSRERIFIVGFNKNYFTNITNFGNIFHFPKPPMKKSCVGDILENIDEKDNTYTISDKMWEGHLSRKSKHVENGNGFGFSLFDENSKYTNTISARYYKDGSEALICQKQYNKNPRMLTPRECARLQGFPENFIVTAVSKGQAYKQLGNSVCVTVVRAIAKQMISALKELETIQKSS